MEGEAHAHLPVLVDEVTFLLRPRRGGWVVDGTIGMGGHAEQLLDTAGGESRLLGIDRDPEALARAARRLERFGARVVLVRGSFRHLRAIATDAGVQRAAAVLLDLGLQTVRSYRKTMMKKLGVNNVAGLTQVALAAGITRFPVPMPDQKAAG